MSVTKKEWSRPAAGGTGMIFSRSWTGDQSKAVLIIAHGMAEHSARYDHFASFLAEHSWAVYMNDHAGHGRSSQPRGFFAEENGWENVVEDLNTLLDCGEKEHPGLPLFLMGHSMGSFLARSFLTRHGDRLSGCIVCGTMGPNPGVKLGKSLADAQCRIRGTKSKGTLINVLAFGSYNKGIAHPVNQFAWLSRDEEICKAYAADKDCGFTFTAAGYRDMFSGILEISTSQWAEAVPKDVPVFVIAGEADPVGSFGKGPRQVADMLKAAGMRDVELKLYPDMRHEIHNEIGKEQVYRDILSWLDSRRDAAC